MNPEQVSPEPQKERENLVRELEGWLAGLKTVVVFFNKLKNFNQELSDQGESLAQKLLSEEFVKSIMEKSGERLLYREELLIDISQNDYENIKRYYEGAIEYIDELLKNIDEAISNVEVSESTQEFKFSSYAEAPGVAETILASDLIKVNAIESYALGAVNNVAQLAQIVERLTREPAKNIDILIALKEELEKIKKELKENYEEGFEKIFLEIQEIKEKRGGEEEEKIQKEIKEE